VTDTATPAVVLLHGVARTPRSLRKMERALQDEGFATLNLGYPSRKYPLEMLADRLHDAIAPFAESADALHFVTHSMGGLLARLYLAKHRPDRLQRVVMLAPPNRGSETARLLAPYLTWMLRPLPELSCSHDSYVCRLPTPKGVDFGIIAASHDTRVTIEQTQLEGQTDHTVVPGGHTFIMNRADVCRQTACFLKEGRFAAT